MTAHVALIRGVMPSNPKMRNAELAKVFESLGHERVRGVISSGNILFESNGSGGDDTDRLEAEIEAALADHLGAPCSAIVRSRAQIEDLADLDVFDAYDDGPTQRCNVTFLKHPPVADPPETGPGSEIVAVRDQLLFSVVDTTAVKTPDLMLKLEKAYGKQITTRTWKTVHRIRAAFAK